MADTEKAPVEAPIAKKTKSPAKVKKVKKSTTNHPKVSEMVNSAISEMKERHGSSLHSIKKHIALNNKVDVEKLAPYIKKYLRNAVVKGALVQTKGKGANGSFKISSPATGKPKSARKAITKATKPKSEAPKPKKAMKSAKASKLMKKAKVTKPKTPKPKKAKKTPVKRAAPKKEAKK